MSNRQLLGNPLVTVVAAMIARLGRMWMLIRSGQLAGWYGIQLDLVVLALIAFFGGLFFQWIFRRRDWKVGLAVAVGVGIGIGLIP
jgi:hypothetical protein